MGKTVNTHKRHIYEIYETQINLLRCLPNRLGSYLKKEFHWWKLFPWIIFHISKIEISAPIYALEIYTRGVSNFQIQQKVENSSLFLKLSMENVTYNRLKKLMR